MPQEIANPRLIDVFDLPFNQDKVDFAIPHLREDLPLYVDPFLLWVNKTAEAQQLHSRLLDFFRDIRSLVIERRRSEAAALLERCREIRELGLGYARGSKKGSAIGPHLANQVLSAFEFVPQLREGRLRHIEELQLIVPGIAEDRISDIVTSILKDYFISFTSKRALELRIPSRSYMMEGIYDGERKAWVPLGRVDLPFNPIDDTPLLFAPLNVLRHLPWINYEDYYRSGYAPYVLGPSRATRHVSKPVVLEYNRTHYTAVERYVDEKERAGSLAKPDPLFRPLSISTLRKKFEELRTIPPGRSDGADRKYEDLVFELLSPLLYPTLQLAESRVRTASGVHIRDLIFYNDAKTPFWQDIRLRYEARQPVFELKNVKALETEHVNQLFRYLDDEFGLFGVGECDQIQPLT